jgi:hypothetical protein
MDTDMAIPAVILRWGLASSGDGLTWVKACDKLPANSFKEMAMRKQRSLAAVGGTLLMVCALGAPAQQGAVPACSLINASRVSEVLGTPVEQQASQTSAICGWARAHDNSPNGKRVLLTVYETLGELSPTDRFTQGKTPSSGVTKTPLSGVGDDAYYVDTTGFGIGLTVKKANFVFQVRVYGFSPSQTKAVEKTLAQDIVGKT